MSVKVFSNIEFLMNCIVELFFIFLYIIKPEFSKFTDSGYSPSSSIKIFFNQIFFFDSQGVFKYMISFVLIEVHYD